MVVFFNDSNTIFTRILSWFVLCSRRTHRPDHNDANEANNEQQQQIITTTTTAV